MAPVQAVLHSSVDSLNDMSSNSSSWAFTQWSSGDAGSQAAAVAAGYDAAAVPAVLWPQSPTHAAAAAVTAVQRHSRPASTDYWNDDIDIDSASLDCSDSVTALPMAEAAAAAETTAAASSWQEEAHWMSFRNAVQYVTQLQQQRCGPTTNTAITSAITSVSTVSAATISNTTNDASAARMASPKVAAAAQQNHAKEEEEDDSSLARYCTHQLKASLLHATTSTASSPCPLPPPPTLTPVKNETQAVHDLVSDLAATKMRLALAQAARDEMEFALLLANNVDNNDDHARNA
jgi:hypothetical protein